MAKTLSTRAKLVVVIMAMALASIFVGFAADDANALPLQRDPQGCSLYIDGVYQGQIDCERVIPWYVAHHL